MAAGPLPAYQLALVGEKTVGRALAARSILATVLESQFLLTVRVAGNERRTRRLPTVSYL